MPADHDVNPLRADARANRDAILEAAARLFAERGSEVPHADIAKAAGVGRATLSRRFPTADSLRLAVLEQLVERLEGILTEVPGGPGALRVFMERALELLDENAPLVQLLRAQALPPAFGEALTGRMGALTAGPLQQAREAGLVRPDATTDDVRLLLIMASSTIRLYTDATVRERVTELAWRAIAT